jgi:hypothetical protein
VPCTLAERSFSTVDHGLSPYLPVVQKGSRAELNMLYLVALDLLQVGAALRGRPWGTPARILPAEECPQRLVLLPKKPAQSNAPWSQTRKDVSREALGR